MKGPTDHNDASSSRRRFLGNTIKLVALAGIVSPLSESCKSNSKPSVQPVTPHQKTPSKTHVNQKKKNRQKGLQEKLVLNSKTNVIHLPTSLTYVYYDQIKNAQPMNAASWEGQVQGQVRFNKDKSGNILEVLSLQKLRNDVNDESLGLAIDTLARAFGPECANKKGVNHNARNYRLHELMLQLVALDGTIPPGGKWQAFNAKVARPPKLGKRQGWMATETAFNDRVNYIQERQNDYKKRLKDRASKYPFT